MIPKVIIEHNIPFIDTYSEWNEISMVEKDEYGRILYSVAATGDSYNNVLSDYIEDDNANSPVFAYIICQKSNAGNVYCYENVSYILVPSLTISDEELNAFKNENDWNKELDEAKLTALPKDFGDTKDSFLTIKDDAVQALEKKIGKDFEGYYIDDLYTETKKLCYVLREVEVWINDNGGETNKFGKAYIFTYDETCGEICYEALSDDIECWRTDIYKFKGRQETGDVSMS